MSARLYGSGVAGAQEINYLKHRNDPGRFFGDGVQFKAKLIGILEVGEARGDRMCQEALQDLKMAIRAAGEHKQRITIHVTIEGLRLRDEKSGDSLYHHPVHKISFIAQDMTDSRAFGYIFGSPDSGHRFFGIKTDKAASQVVLAMRDLFQVVFELKKEEIELARQQIQSKSTHDNPTLSSLSLIKTGELNDLNGGGEASSSSVRCNFDAGATGSNANIGYGTTEVKTVISSNVKEMSSEYVADLVDLEQELSSIQRGITQMERITPNEPTPNMVSSGRIVGTDEDPFGDSFTNVPAYKLLPPPESSRSRTKPNKPVDSVGKTGTASTTETIDRSSHTSNVPKIAKFPPIANLDSSDIHSTANVYQDSGGSWVPECVQQDFFEIPRSDFIGAHAGVSSLSSAPCETLSTPTNQLVTDVKNLEPSSLEAVGSSKTSHLMVTSVEPDQTQIIKSGGETDTSFGTTNDANPVLLPCDTDPFSPTRKKSDPFDESDLFSNMDPFEFEFPVSNELTVNAKQQEQQPQWSSPAKAEGRKPVDVFNGPLQVSLPPENNSSTFSTTNPPRNHGQRKEGLPSVENNTSVRSRPTLSSGVYRQNTTNISATSPQSAFRQQTADVISSISSKKMPHLFGQAARFSKRDSNVITMRRLQESDSFSENEAAPEPPPRPDLALHSEPPPLPPKKQFSDIVIRPHNVTCVATASTTNRSESLTKTTKISHLDRFGGDVPPIPLPSRRLGRSDGTYPGPGRPRKPGYTEDDYLAPFDSSGSTVSSSMPSDVPPLLPPPTQSSTRLPRAQRQQTSRSQDIYENKLEIMQQQRTKTRSEITSPSPVIADMTLSQLLTLGIDELAIKLNVPSSKLNTMTLVELTAYLTEFIEKSKSSQINPTHAPSGASPNPIIEAAKQEDMTAVFKVNFDQEATFVATFDDNFGENQCTEYPAFAVNFANFNESAAVSECPANVIAAVPPPDRYAVFREIIDQELQQLKQEKDLLGHILPEDSSAIAENNLPSLDQSVVREDTQSLESSVVPPVKIDTKITEVVAQAKDRYAALRDIILVENLFESQAKTVGSESETIQELTEFENGKIHFKPLTHHPERTNSLILRPAEVSFSSPPIEDYDEDGDGVKESDNDDGNGDGGSGLDDSVKQILDSDVSQARGLLSDQGEKVSTQQLAMEKTELNGEENVLPDSQFITVTEATKDDLEIDVLMQRALSNLSLESRERTTPVSATPFTTLLKSDPLLTTAITPVSTCSPAEKIEFNDVSTSPIALSTIKNKAPQKSPIPTQLSAVSDLIDTAAKEISADLKSVLSPESWATFDSPKPTRSLATAGGTKKSARSQKNISRRRSKSPKAKLSSLPPPFPSNASQNDTAESPCSSDAREDGWSKYERRWPRRDRGSGGSNAQQTSSSSRDASPWDDEEAHTAYQKKRGVVYAHQLHSHPDRHGCYMRYTRRMNSCEEDYNYADELNKRRDQRKQKEAILRSRDDFEFDSTNSYHHPHPAWSPSNDSSSFNANSRARSFDRSAYERSTYGPPTYDKRGVALTAASISSFDRRTGSDYDKRKYYRDFCRPGYDFEGYDERYDEPHSERLGRWDYENIYDVGNRSPMVYGSKVSRGDGFLYECEGKSFDRESIDSFESTKHKQRSFGSGNIYDGFDIREEFRERYIDAGSDQKITRSLRKGGVKMLRNAKPDVDYEQNSDVNDLYRQERSLYGASVETRSLQRPNQLGSTGQQRARKSSGSSPWDGEEAVPHMEESTITTAIYSQKPWKRSSSVAEPERRLPENRRSAGLEQTPLGCDGERDRRFRKKQRLRKELPPPCIRATSRFVGANQSAAIVPDNYDYITYANDDDDDDDDNDDDDIDDPAPYVDDEYDEAPTDEDKFERINRRRHEMHQRLLENEQRHQHYSSCKAAVAEAAANVGSRKYQESPSELDITPRSRDGPSKVLAITGEVAKFNLDDQGGFESDFNQSSSPPPHPLAGMASSCSSGHVATVTATSDSSFRFSNDFSERAKLHTGKQGSSLQQIELTSRESVSPATTEHVAAPAITQRLRFDDNVKVSKFNDNTSCTFEDEFARAELDFEATDHSIHTVMSVKKNHVRNNKLQQRQDQIKKSESVNIFARRKSEDPFEDDEFFNAPESLTSVDVSDKNQSVADSTDANFEQWDECENNFAKFEENM